MKRVRVNKSVAAPDIKSKTTKHYQMKIRNNNSGKKDYSVFLVVILAVVILGALMLVL